ncbi:RDD family protein [Flavobacterium sp.]|uniref:RDD family protein n=1 Tax=Flavobacterium sp. TaxID=239 RepID=UPI002616671F|nr:RDD family protein [Flavobacterium sp.]
MSEISILTTQNVAIDFTAASIGQRILATLLDTLVQLGYFFFISLFVFRYLGLSDYFQNFDTWSQIAILILLFLPVIVYSLTLETILEGQSLGKKIVGIRVVKIDGYEAGFGDYLIRWFFRCVDVLIASGTVGLIAIVATKRSQRIGDLAAGTAVISLRRNASVKQTILIELEDSYKPTYQQVLKLSDNDVRIIKNVFETASADFDVARIKQLRTKVESVIGEQPQELSDTRLIDTVLRDYNYYTGQA